MSSEPARKEDQSLQELLQTWTIQATLPPRFREGVWQRIAREERESISRLTHWGRALAAGWRSLMLRPIGAVSYLTLLLIVGASLGYWESERYSEHVETAWRSAYVQAVSPDAALNSR